MHWHYQAAASYSTQGLWCLQGMLIGTLAHIHAASPLPARSQVFFLFFPFFLSECFFLTVPRGAIFQNTLKQRIQIQNEITNILAFSLNSWQVVKLLYTSKVSCSIIFSRLHNWVCEIQPHNQKGVSNVLPTVVLDNPGDYRVFLTSLCCMILYCREI